MAHALPFTSLRNFIHLAGWQWRLIRTGRDSALVGDDGHGAGGGYSITRRRPHPSAGDMAPSLAFLPLSCAGESLPLPSLFLPLPAT
jgi:hypothetical protein